MTNKPTMLLALFSVALMFIAPNCFAKTPQYIKYNADSIANVKVSLQSGQAKAPTQKAYKRLIKSANKALTMTNPSVIDKAFLPPTKNKHDYLSISRYWWPDPKSADGLPWIRKDGITNPDTQTDDVDRKRLGLTMQSIKVLSLAYYFSDEEKYAQKAISLINTWFIAKETKMNPHVEYGQSIPGYAQKRRSGILDGRIIPEFVIDAITMLSRSPLWTSDLDQQMKTWLTDYFTWLTTSEIGIAGSQQSNNHGSWYRFQVAALAWYLGNDKFLTKAVTDTQYYLPEQVSPSGAQSHELARTRGFFYSCFNLQALSIIADLAEKGTVPLWDYKSPQGQSLTLAIDYLMPVANGEKWPHNSKKIQLSQLAMVLGKMLPYTSDPKYHSTLRKILKDIGNKKKLSANEKQVYYNFALLSPELM